MQKLSVEKMQKLSWRKCKNYPWRKCKNYPGVLCCVVGVVWLRHVLGGGKRGKRGRGRGGLNTVLLGAREWSDWEGDGGGAIGNPGGGNTCWGCTEAKGNVPGSGRAGVSEPRNDELQDGEAERGGGVS